MQNKILINDENKLKIRLLLFETHKNDIQIN